MGNVWQHVRAVPPDYIPKSLHDTIEAIDPGVLRNQHLESVRTRWHGGRRVCTTVNRCTMKNPGALDTLLQTLPNRSDQSPRPCSSEAL